MKNRTFANLSEFKSRRDRLNQLAPRSAIVLFSGKESGWERFRAHSDFVYLTGFEEPDSAVVILPGQDKPFKMFVRPRDPAKEIWDGFRYGLEGAKEVFGADESFLIDEFYNELPKMLAEVDRVYFALSGELTDLDFVRSVKKYVSTMGRSGRGLLPIFDPKEILGEMRLIKSEQEIQWHREACRISAEAHKVLIEQVRPGMNEKDVQAILFKEFYARGAHREGYFSIIAAGANATILHYRDNNSPSKDGDLLLVDAGAEKNYFTADITRTFPMNGKFTIEQKAVYEKVLKVQKDLIAMVKPGLAYETLQNEAIRGLTQALIELGFLKGSLDENIQKLTFRKYYPHNIGHFLGMDVHDVGLYKVNGQSRPLEAGMILTVEPGIYVPADDASVPEAYRGIGVRIEDDILVTKTGHEVMTALAPKEVVDITRG